MTKDKGWLFAVDKGYHTFKCVKIYWAYRYYVAQQLDEVGVLSSTDKHSTVRTKTNYAKWYEFIFKDKSDEKQQIAEEIFYLQKSIRLLEKSSYDKAIQIIKNHIKQLEHYERQPTGSTDPQKPRAKVA